MTDRSGLDPLAARASTAIPRPRILGLETEYAILYQPDDPAAAGDDPAAAGDDPAAGAKPPFPLLESVLFEAVLHGRKAALSSGLKGGYFIENGGLVHLEFFLHEQSDTPVLEASTPECTSPRELLLYQRAFDRLLVGVSRRSRELLQNRGYSGRISFGKNNLDSRGVGYGCHENYLVHYTPRWQERWLAVASLPVLLALAIPFLLLTATLIILSLAIGVLGLFLLPLRALASAFPGLRRGLRGMWTRLRSRMPRRFTEALWLTFYYVINAFLFPLIFGYTLLLRVVAYRPFFRHLTSFLISRQILTGSGHLNPRRGRFELSQRAGLTTSVSKIIMLGRRKTMFDLKGFLFQPQALFRSSRKLSLSVGDSNLADLSNLLKLGATTLVLEMIENGEDFSDLRVKKPVRAFRAVSTDGPWKDLPLRDGRTRATAIGIQREYLSRAKRYLERRAGGGPDANAAFEEVVRLWEGTLAAFEDDLASLNRRLDWAAKKSILDHAILASSDWNEFAAWSRFLARLNPAEFGRFRRAAASDGRARAQRSFDRRLRRRRLSWDRAQAMVDLYLQCRKIDLKYHELGGVSGYERQLEAARMIERSTDEDQVRHALAEPPAGTRARIRGYYIKRSASPASLRANWNEIQMTGTGEVISLVNPFYSTLPEE